MVDEAYASCERDARKHYENFPVASLLLPREIRRHVAALYAFARAADDFADEGSRTMAERQVLLDRWIRRLREAVESAAPGAAPQPGEPPNTVAIFLAVGASIRAHELPIQLFDDLVSAFHQDTSSTRYDTWAELFDYCRRSANPIGRLVLRIAGYQDGRLDGWSDDICTALQLTNFWQDVKGDFDRGRLYIPLEELRAHGAREDDLIAGRMTPAWRSVLSGAAARTRARFDAGKPLCDAMRGRMRYQIRATWLGGMRILDRLEHDEFDVMRHRPVLGLLDAPWFAWRLLMWNAPREALLDGPARS